jgi:hypothetical protein
MATPNHPVDELYKIVTPIQYPNREDYATGFFFSTLETVEVGDTTLPPPAYLITNHHVVAELDEEDGEYKPIDESIRILMRLDKDNPRDIDYIDIPLMSDGEKNWIEHPDGPDVDIAAVPLDFSFFLNSSSRFFSPKQFRPDEVRIKAGTKAIVASYPIRGTSPYFPILRDALIASPYGERFGGRPCFAIDADMHSGTSGSPVITTPSTLRHTESRTEIGGQEPYLLGVHSATVESNHDENEGPLNLNYEWYAELIMEMDLSWRNHHDLMMNMSEST